MAVSTVSGESCTGTGRSSSRNRNRSRTSAIDDGRPTSDRGRACRPRSTARAPDCPTRGGVIARRGTIARLARRRACSDALPRLDPLRRFASGECLFQLASRFEQPALRGSLGDLENAGDLTMRVPFDLAQQKHVPIDRRQPVNRALQRQSHRVVARRCR